MAGLSLDMNPDSPDYGDLLRINGALVMTSDVDARGTNNVLQDILCRLRTFEGEWFLNINLGMPYFQRMLVKNPDLALISAAYKDTILGTPGVKSLDKFTLDVDRLTRRLFISFACTTVSGKVSYSSQPSSPVNGVAQVV